MGVGGLGGLGGLGLGVTVYKIGRWCESAWASALLGPRVGQEAQAVNRINRIHEEMPAIASHHKNLQYLSIELNNTFNDLLPAVKILISSPN